jgi:poly-gamma-glutamate synthesis protein (capsule biosynthesis protein)
VIAAVGFFAVHACTRSASVDTQDQTALTATEDGYTPEAQTTTLTVTFAGDCTLGTDEYFSYSTSFNAMYEAVADPSYFLKNVNALFSADDLTVVNMEGTLTTSTSRADKTYAFKGDAEYTQVFTTSSVEAASVANNHSHDYGDQSYTDTINAMEAAGIPTFGYDRIAYMDVKGVKVALIGTYELAEGLGIKDSMVENIQTARAEGAQLVMVYFHWGIERDTVPNSTQISLAHAAVDAGADLVVGSHPHVIQGWEKYNGKYIVYSLGNFCFGGNSNPSDKDCMIFQQTFTITGDEVATDDQVSFIAASISSTSGSNNYQPTIAEGSEKTRIEAKIQESTDSIAALVASGTS